MSVTLTVATPDGPAHPHGNRRQQIRYRIGQLQWDRDEIDIFRPRGWRDQMTELQARIDQLKAELADGPRR